MGRSEKEEEGEGGGGASAAAAAAADALGAKKVSGLFPASLRHRIASFDVVEIGEHCGITEARDRQQRKLVEEATPGGRRRSCITPPETRSAHLGSGPAFAIGQSHISISILSPFRHPSLFSPSLSTPSLGILPSVSLKSSTGESCRPAPVAATAATAAAAEEVAAAARAARGRSPRSSRPAPCKPGSTFCPAAWPGANTSPVSLQMRIESLVWWS